MDYSLRLSLASSCYKLRFCYHSHSAYSVPFRQSDNGKYHLIIMMLSVLRWSLVRFVICGNLTDDGTHWPLCVRVGTELAVSVCPEIPEVRRFFGTTSAGTRHYTLGMSAVSDHAAATSRLPSEVKAIWNHDSSDVQAKPSYRYYLTSRAEVGENKKGCAENGEPKLSWSSIFRSSIFSRPPKMGRRREE